jgi:O-antigen ligase
MNYSGILFNGIRASFNHYNDFASFLVAVFFINLGMLFKTKKPWLKMILGFLGFLVIADILFTGSRGAWLSFLLAIFPLGFILYRKKQTNLIYMLCIVSFFILAVFWLTPLTDRLFYSFKMGGDSDRLKIWRISLLMLKDSPLLGKGIGLFMDYLPKYAYIGAEYAHNCYLQILVETGIIGLLPFLLFLGTIITQGLVKIIRNFDELFLGLFSAFIAFLIHSFFDTQLYSLKLSILFWLLASFITIHLTEPVKHNALSSP